MREDKYYSIYDITIASMNRPHKHKHVEEGLESFTYNWELLEEDDSLRRGSSKLYIVSDSYYVSCSRTGLEKSGNSLRFSSNCPDELIYEVVSAVFEGVLRRKSIDISDGLDKSEFFGSDSSLKVSTPKEFVLATDCSDEELDMYYDELANLLYKTIEKYQKSNSVEEIESIVESYRKNSKQLYREYKDFEPSILSQVIPKMNGKNGWIIRGSEIDAGKTLYIIRNENNGIESDAFCIEIIKDEKVELVEQITETVLEKKTYETKNELQKILDEFMGYKFDELKNRDY